MVGFRSNLEPHKHHRLGFKVPLLALIVEYLGMTAKNMEIGDIRHMPKEDFVRGSLG